MVLISNSRGYVLIDGDDRPLCRQERDTTWSAGLRLALRAMPASSRLVVLADFPHMSRDVPRCLSHHRSRIAACVTRRATAIRRAHDQVERSTAQHAGATFVSMNGRNCAYDPCPVVVNELLLYRDKGHLTATYTRALSASLAAVIRDALAAPARSPATRTGGNP